MDPPANDPAPPGATFVHPTADVAEDAIVGPGTQIWQQVQVRSGALIGAECILGKGVYVDTGVRIGSRCKLENGVYVYRGVSVEDGVFLGPGAMLLNDKQPRAINPDGTLKSDADWTVSHGHVAYGAAIGGGVVVLPGVHVGRWALVGAGSVVTKDVPDHGLVWGNPARLRGFVCTCAQRLQLDRTEGSRCQMVCPGCGASFEIAQGDYGRATG